MRIAPRHALSATAPQVLGAYVMAQMSLLGIPQNPNDVVFTPDWLAKEIIEHFAPVGVCLDPCKGDGAFYLSHL